MEKSPYNAALQATACENIARWARDEYYRVVIVSSGGLTCILNAMNLHPNDAVVQANACVALGNLSVNSINFKSKIVSLGGIGVITQVLKNHINSHSAQASAFFALKLLTSTSSGKTQQTRTESVRNLFSKTIK